MESVKGLDELLAPHQHQTGSHPWRKCAHIRLCGRQGGEADCPDCSGVIAPPKLGMCDSKYGSYVDVS
jgi:hypothetical protein